MPLPGECRLFPIQCDASLRRYGMALLAPLSKPRRTGAANRESVNEAQIKNYKTVHCIIYTAKSVNLISHLDSIDFFCELEKRSDNYFNQSHIDDKLGTAHVPGNVLMV